MTFFKKIKLWFKKHKKVILISGTVLAIIGTGVVYILSKNKNKISFDEWIKTAPKEELQEAHEILRVDFCKNGIESYEMRKISEELGHRGAQEWFAKHPRNTDPNFRWTDANRWDRD